MSDRHLWYVMSVVAVILVLVLGWSAQVRSRASAEVVTAVNQHRQVVGDVATVTSLRSSSNGLSIGPRPDADLVARTQQALVEAGLPIAACSGVQPRADQQVRQQGISVQSVLVSLQNLRPGEFGSWLAAWNAHRSPWRITELQLVHAPVREATKSDLDLNRFDYTVALAAPYVEKSP
ncbi:MAG: hypothetical protein H0W83_04665 [Planctomycetes bacterium]|nr:hypothetical protein [Planctomycetota bacterium]